MNKVQAHYRRLNITIREDQYQRLVDGGLNISGLFRDLIDDRFSSTRVVLTLSEEARRIYDILVSNFGISDLDLEPYFLEALEDVLEKRATEITSFQTILREKNRRKIKPTASGKSRPAKG